MGLRESWDEKWQQDGDGPVLSVSPHTNALEEYGPRRGGPWLWLAQLFAEEIALEPHAFPFVVCVCADATFSIMPYMFAQRGSCSLEETDIIRVWWAKHQDAAALEAPSRSVWLDLPGGVQQPYSEYREVLSAPAH